MKKFLIILLILFLLFGGFFGYKFVSHKIKEAKIAEIKKGWYVEVQNEYIFIRKEADRNSAEIGKALKGDVFEVTDMEIHGNNYWYKIKFDKGKVGWIANPSGTNYLDDGNNPEDIAAPKIRYFEEIYYVDTIDDINYKHLEVTDDRDEVTVTHLVFHEVVESEGKDQYWIQYIATDGVGKTTKIVQKIVFNTRPDESQVLDFSELKRK